MSWPVRIIDAVAGVIVVLGLPVTLALDLFSNLTSRLANLRCLGLSVGIAIAFVAGAWVQDTRVRDDYRRKGEIAATYDAILDGYWLYLGCLSNDCAREKRASDFIVKRARQRLANLERAGDGL